MIRLRKRKKVKAEQVVEIEYVKGLKDRLAKAHIPLNSFEDASWITTYLLPTAGTTTALETRTSPAQFKEILEDAGVDSRFLRWDCCGLFYVYY